jgi:Ca-activated chloride channel family protein
MADKHQNRSEVPPAYWFAGLVAFALALVWIWSGTGWDFRRLWVTEAQAVQTQLTNDDFEAVVNRTSDPFARGFAFYRMGEFKRAAGEFQRLSSPEAAFNLGNALVFQGEYEAAIDAYSRALEMRPDWEAPRTNTAICEARLVAMAPPEDDAGGTGGMLGADEIVIDDRGKNTSGDQTEQVEGAGGQLSQEEMRALWLRKVQTRPADFLRSKFSYQLQTGGES